jgi:crossover junction endodeoxyribonuclease RuvC
MIIIGIDPGVIYTGYGVIKIKERCVRAVDYGIIEIAREQDLPARLAGIYKRIAGLCEQLQPDALAVEEVFFNKNARTALTVGHVRGAIILAALHQGAEVFSYTPLQIKQTVSGYGRADKEQMQRMVKLLLKLQELPKPDHAADALAAAICHYYMSRSTNRLLSETKWGGAR